MSLVRNPGGGGGEAIATGGEGDELGKKSGVFTGVCGVDSVEIGGNEDRARTRTRERPMYAVRQRTEEGPESAHCTSVNNVEWWREAKTDLEKNGAKSGLLR